MPKEVIGHTPIRTVAEAESLPHESERILAQAALTHNPQLIILYEPAIFSHIDEDGKQMAHVPDFHIINPKNVRVAERGIYVEVTIERRKGAQKRKQHKVMRHGAPGERYVQLKRQFIMNIEHARKKRERTKVAMQPDIQPQGQLRIVDLEEGVAVPIELNRQEAGQLVQQAV